MENFLTKGRIEVKLDSDYQLNLRFCALMRPRFAKNNWRRKKLRSGCQSGSQSKTNFGTPLKLEKATVALLS